MKYPWHTWFSFDIIPMLKNSIIKKFWGGFLDLTPDSLPVLDNVSEEEGLVVGAGFSGHGFGTAPANSHILCSHVLGINSKIPFGTFSIGRFKNGNNATSALAYQQNCESSIRSSVN